MDNAAKIVNSAIIGMDFKTVVIAGKAYTIHPPTIKKLAGAGYYLSDVKEGESIKDLLLSLNDSGSLAHALSWIIQGNDELFEELSEGTYTEIVDALDMAYSMISAQSFCNLSTLARNVAGLTARQR